MKQYMFNDRSGKKYIRVSKPTAKKLYLSGKTVLLCASNLKPFASPFTEPYRLNRKSREHFCIDEIGVRNDFEGVSASFKYYNCINSQTGRTVAFYTEVD